MGREDVKKVNHGKPRGDMAFGLSKVNRECLCYACGFEPEDLAKPFIGVITQWSEIHPGEVHVLRLVDQIKYGIREAGGTPFHINIGGYCDGVLLGNRRYTFAQRNLIADSIELAAEANLLDGLVLVASCDKNVPAALMAAARTNLPSIIVTGGIMAPGYMDGKQLTVDDVNNAVGEKHRGLCDEDRLNRLITASCPGGGACSTLTTGSTMQMISEALGMSLPMNSSMLGMGREILTVARKAGRLVMDMQKKGIRARNIITPESIENAIKVCLAVGGSIHSMYHIPAIGVEAGLEADYWELFDRFSHVIPALVGIVPNGPHTMWDFHLAGGLPAVMNNIKTFLNPDPLTVTGAPIGTYYEKAKVVNENVIQSIDKPWKTDGGLAVLKGNLAPLGAVIRTSGVKDTMMKFTGVARVFTSDVDARRSLRENRPERPTVIVIGYQGMKGAPGVNTLLPLSAEIIGMGLEETVAVVTDGRFSGGARGCCVGLVTPEAADGGNIAYVNDGDEVTIDIPGRTVTVNVSEEVLAERRLTQPIKMREPKSNYLKIFLRNVQPLSRGGVAGEWPRSGYTSITEADEVTP